MMIREPETEKHLLLYFIALLLVLIVGIALAFADVF